MCEREVITSLQNPGPVSLLSSRLQTSPASDKSPTCGLVQDSRVGQGALPVWEDECCPGRVSFIASCAARDERLKADSSSGAERSLVFRFVPTAGTVPPVVLVSSMTWEVWPGPQCRGGMQDQAPNRDPGAKESLWSWLSGIIGSFKIRPAESTQILGYS